MKKSIITIATRESPLALKQAYWVAEQLRHHHPGLTVKLLGMTTEADRRLDVTLEKIGGKGLFVKELELALLDGRADLAVHSMKDVPMTFPDQLIVPVICEREDPRDVFVSNQFESIANMPNAAILGTSSLRRQTQIRHHRPHLTIENLRGNINTRLKRLDDGQFQGIVLAAAGLKRLGLGSRIRQYFDPAFSLPAAGQGALGLECHAENQELIQLIEPLNHTISAQCVNAERAVCIRLQGGCMVPIGAYAEVNGEDLFLRALIANVDGTEILRAELNGHAADANDIGLRVAEQLLAQGADAILREFRDY